MPDLLLKAAGSLVDTEHLYIAPGPALLCKPGFKLDHLNVLEAYACVDFAVDNSLCHILYHVEGQQYSKTRRYELRGNLLVLLSQYHKTQNKIWNPASTRTIPQRTA